MAMQDVTKFRVMIELEVSAPVTDRAAHVVGLVTRQGFRVVQVEEVSGPAAQQGFRFDEGGEDGER